MSGHTLSLFPPPPLRGAEQDAAVLCDWLIEQGVDVESVSGEWLIANVDEWPVWVQGVTMRALVGLAPILYEAPFNRGIRRCVGDQRDHSQRRARWRLLQGKYAARRILRVGRGLQLNPLPDVLVPWPVALRDVRRACPGARWCLMSGDEDGRGLRIRDLHRRVSNTLPWVGRSVPVYLG